MNLKPDEVQFHSASMIDSVGRLFSWNGSLYRAINKDSAAFCLDLFEKKRIQDLFSKGLIETEIAPLSLEGYGLVLKHRRIPFESYCMEWTGDMLKDAALLLCDLSLELLERGLTFKDAHPWNILFDGGTPIFVDWGSLGRLEESLAWPYLEFRNRFLFPLFLISSGRCSITRDFMFDTVDSPWRGDIFRLMLNRIPFSRWLRYLWVDDHLKKGSVITTQLFLEKLRKSVQSIPLVADKTDWSSYNGPGEIVPTMTAESWPPKIRAVQSLLQRIKPGTVMDIGCNRGWFSELAAREGAQVVAIDLDEPSLSALYQKVRSNGSSILPLFMDIVRATPTYGLMEAYRSAKERLRVDMVLALALTHHLVFKRGLRFEGIAGLLAGFTKRWLLVEFVPPDDQYVREWMNERFSWYHLDGFQRALKGIFSRIEIVNSYPSPRVLLLCER